MRGDLHQFLFTSLYLGFSLFAVCVDDRPLWQMHGSLPRLSLQSQNADVAGIFSRGVIYMDCRKHWHMVEGMALSRSRKRLGDGLAGKAWILVSVDDYFICAGDAGSKTEAIHP